MLAVRFDRQWRSLTVAQKQKIETDLKIGGAL
jgi:hypothetical protein